MKNLGSIILALILSFAMGLVLSVHAEELNPVKLPEVKLDPTKSLAQALKDRKTTRAYTGENLPEQVLSNMLWAACGINRPDSGRRTAPTAKNWQEIDVYISTAKGTYLYNPKDHTLIPAALGDIRPLTYTQVDRFKDAPVHLVYVADLDKMDGEDSAKMVLAGMDTGFVSQNVYLYCASEGLPTCYRVSIHKDKLAEALQLKPSQKIMGAQSVGLPKEK